MRIQEAGVSRHGRNDVGAGLRIAQPDRVAGPHIHHIGRAGHRLASCRTDAGVVAGLPIAHTRRRLPVEPKRSWGPAWLARTGATVAKV